MVRKFSYISSLLSFSSRKRGAVWHSHCLQCQHPLWAPVHVPASPNAGDPATHVGDLHEAPHFSLARVHYQGAGFKVEQLGLKPVFQYGMSALQAWLNPVCHITSPLFFFHKDTTHVDLGTTLLQFYFILIIYGKVSFPNKVTFTSTRS